MAQGVSPLKSAAVVLGAVKVLVGSVAGILLASDLLSADAKAVVGLVVGVLLAVTGAADVVVRQLQGEDPAHPAEPLRWSSPPETPASPPPSKPLGPAGSLALVACLGAALAAGGCGPAYIAPGTPAAVESACARLPEPIADWAAVAAPYLKTADAVRLETALDRIESSAPIVCSLVRLGLEMALEQQAQAAVNGAGD